VAKETLEIYAPIAQRLGIDLLRTELEDLSFKALHPGRYEVLSQRIEKRLGGDSHAVIRKVETRLQQALQEEGIQARVMGRQKSLYGIYQKMQRKNLHLEEIMDLVGFRVIVNKVDDCYRSLGIVHHVYRPISELFNDYIANPKVNGYQSIHTTCAGAQGLKIEVQIRTEEMHSIADAGIAAHWQYKLGRDPNSAPQLRAREWLGSLLDIEGGTAALDFYENVKVDLFPDEVYVFTPKGQIRRLPKAATPVDFAYAVHSELGNQCVAARIDQNLEPLSTPLENGQTVEIIIAKHAHPNAAWLNFVKTAKARGAIRSFLKNQREDEAIRLGRRLLEIALRELKIPISVLKDEAVESVLKSYELADIEELYMSIGVGSRLAPLVARHFLSEKVESDGEPHETLPLAVEGTEGLVVDYAKCCHPLPGDEICGYVSVGRGIVIHRLDCRHAHHNRSSTQERIALVWSPNVSGDFIAELRLKAQDRRGLLASVAAEIASAQSSIESIQMPDRSGSDVVEMRFLLTVRDRDHLARVMRRLRRREAVERVVRP
jgi:GTP pyrophosphokinase